MNTRLMLMLAFLVGGAMASEQCYAGTYITPGTPAALGGAQTNLTSTVANFPVEAGRSYACSLLGSSSDTNLAIASIDPVGDTWKYCGAITPAIAAGSSDQDHANNRICFVTTVAGTKALTISSDRSGGEPSRFECLETTLYGGYNTFVNPWNFLELINTSNAELRVYISAVNYDGTTVINNLTYLIPANARQDVDLHTPAGSNRYGLVKVTHNGPYGAIQGQVSQYRGPAAGMELTASTPVRPRDQNL